MNHLSKFGLMDILEYMPKELKSILDYHYIIHIFLEY